MSSIMKVLHHEGGGQQWSLKALQTAGVMCSYLRSLDWLLVCGAPGVLCAETKANVPFKQIISIPVKTF